MAIMSDGKIINPPNPSAAPIITSQPNQPLDMLRTMFDMQKSLNVRVGVITDEICKDREKQTEWILKFTLVARQELAELVDCVPYKWWAKYQKFDDQNIRVELIDILHFWISLCQVAGLSADDVFKAYLAKNAVNFARQDSGYATKDENDSRHI